MKKELLKKSLLEVYVFISLFALLVSCGNRTQTFSEIKPRSLDNEVVKKYRADMIQCIAMVDSLSKSTTRTQMERFYLKSRMYFKKLEPVMAFHDAQNYKFLNAPNIPKIEEEDATNIKIMEPKSFQVLEETIFTDSLDVPKIQRTANLIRNRLRLLEKNTDLSYLKEHHFLWLLRDGFMRVAQTGITGFDSPVLENSLEEGIVVYRALKDYLILMEPLFKKQELFQEWLSEIDASITDLNTADFSFFNRYAFIKEHTNPQLQLFNKTAADWEVVFPFTLALNNDASSLFSEDAFNGKFFSDYRNKTSSKELIVLGRTLFNDQGLSKSRTVSCASCHLKDKAFTDGKTTSDGQLRNSPTLTYAALQQNYFYDSRAGSLEGQIVSVVENDSEFHTDLATLQKTVQKNKSYKAQFDLLYNGEINDYNIRNAMAAYIRSLSKFNSKFDRNINGLEDTMTESEIQGFNLFMGKAKCATCHFAPIFNGTVPPNYTETEMELLGVPAKNDTLNAMVDADLGAFNVFGTEARKFFFKTPTVRNIELTGPYMHNGVYTTLEEVVDFYNRGGGAGIGIDLEYQTLPPDKLELNGQEKKALIEFMKSLTDQQAMDKVSAAL